MSDPNYATYPVNVAAAYEAEQEANWVSDMRTVLIIANAHARATLLNVTEDRKETLSNLADDLQSHIRLLDIDIDSLMAKVDRNGGSV